MKLDMVIVQLCASNEEFRNELVEEVFHEVGCGIRKRKPRKDEVARVMVKVVELMRICKEHEDLATERMISSGIEFSRSKAVIYMSQRKYALDILQDTGFTGARPNKFPMEQYLKLTPDDGELLKDPVKYRRLVGQLIYLTVTRPDIAFLVRTLSQYIPAPQKPHWDAAIRVLKYIKGSPGQGLLLPSENNLTLTTYCDSDWAGCQTTRRSVSGYCIFLGSNVLRSSAEAEYCAMVITCLEIV
ncbi:uncharacterized mitochondrial protein AtMg00810-like [Phaseolus vulgaris]|uniref:uncharacterized mitochondrial protein AtMg00810-like n=1 Tax=Phaseolus vulgaris TaxID=3885 RepID=UPI0035CA2D49